MKNRISVLITQHPGCLVTLVRYPDGQELASKTLAVQCTEPGKTFDLLTSVFRETAKTEGWIFRLETYDDAGGRVSVEEHTPTKKAA